MKLVKTGIAGLDEFLTGGLPPKVLLLSGSPGAGNEIFAREVAFARSRQIGVTYFTINSTAETIREDMQLYNWDIAPQESNGNWKFQSLPKTVGLQEMIIPELEQHRTVIIDSLSEILLSRKIDEVVNLLTAMTKQNRNSDEFHFLLLTEGMQDTKAETTVQHFAEGVIVFNTTFTSDSAHRDLLVKKMKGAFLPARRLPYTIGKKGFVIETATRIT